MIPITLGLGDGAESRAPMGACVVGVGQIGVDLPQCRLALEDPSYNFV